jgi:hypothetical protein
MSYRNSHSKPWNFGLTKEDPRVLAMTQKTMKTKLEKDISFNYKAKYYEDLGHKVRSSWEANFARYLIFKNIPYVYEAYKISFEDGHSYLPDYYLPIQKIFVEIHPTSMMNEKFNKKIEKARNEIEKENDSNFIGLFLINTELYNDMVKELEYAYQT